MAHQQAQGFPFRRAIRMWRRTKPGRNSTRIAPRGNKGATGRGFAVKVRHARSGHRVGISRLFTMQDLGRNGLSIEIGHSPGVAVG